MEIILLVEQSVPKKYQIITKVFKIHEIGKHVVIQKLRDYYVLLLYSILID